MVTELSEDPKKALKNQVVAVVVFYSPVCEDCKRSEEYESVLSEAFKDQVEFYRLDAINQEEIADSYGIDTYPTYILFRNGKAMQGILLEPIAQGEIQNWLEIHLRSKFPKILRIKNHWPKF